jgi:Putative effector of murein hydrolase LrgA
MKNLCGLGIILLISFIGEMANYLLPLPIPGSIYGLILLFILLQARVIPLEMIKAVSSFLIEIMPVMFVPATVKLMESWGILAPRIFSFSIVTIVSTIVVMVVAGKVVQRILDERGGNDERDTD